MTLYLRTEPSGLLLLRLLRSELLQPQSRHVHDDLGGAVFRRTWVTTTCTWALATSRTRCTRPSSAGAEFFNGVRWSDNLKELKYLIKRGKQDLSQHLLEADEYRRLFYDSEISEVGAGSTFRVKLG